MNIENAGDNLVVTGLKDFNLAQTLECGQCFHFQRMDKGADPKAKSAGNEDIHSAYVLTAFGKLLFLTQEDDVFTFYNTGREELEKIWIPYFDLNRDYVAIKRSIAENSPELTGAIEDNAGIRLLNQEFFETLMSFIISQNNQIPRIKKLVNDISDKWGAKLELDLPAYGNIVLSSFPGAEELREVTEKDFFNIRTGFRAKYLKNAVEKVLDGSIKGEELMKLRSADCEKILTSIKGVGPKVANCIMLFSLGKRDAFPVDVWMKRIMEEVYFNGEDTRKEKIAEFAYEKFGDLGGYAQQYLFAFARRKS
ncbi:MAG: DNA glycosylase [Clostridiales bacterium]|nr:DNA glycosylase [Clostridiales bacterium]MDU0939122.1 DNA glycosylase [Clostridiales bacterium]MDU1041744.1 DNA glycosylase [Clostridiales bacterium]MDU3490799.1 DNA glycosylase [Clostridiales bacterium]